ncbi:MAG TPA: DUF6766 family protein [Lacunisphaera sp.]|nr:DUF6766 family protein [Lacunisphaera sp.]
MKKFFRNHGLSLVLGGFFLATLLLGQFCTGRAEYNEDRAQRNLPPVSATEYWTSPHFLEATTENWESEFFQMFIYVALTVFLFQKGSAESNDPDKPHAPEPALTRRSPWPARRGGWVRKVYEHSLSLAFAVLFLISFTLHAASGTRLRNEEESAHGRSPKSVREYLASSRFWFESFQNWQSEFLAIGSMVVLSIFLREKNSPESKPVNLPHADHEQ